MIFENLSYIQAKQGQGKIPCYHAFNNDTDIIKILESNKEEINQQILKFGGMLFRGFNLRAVSEFNRLANLISPNLLDYTNRSTPRTKLGGKIYTSTEYPADREILFHNENSYTLAWPKKIMFFCVIAAEQGGETPITDSRFVFKSIDRKIIDQFTTKRVLYVRNYIPGVDLSWQEAFQTDDKKEVEEYCRINSIDYIWPNQSNIDLITKQVCQATTKHPITGDEVWFNQAHLFHISSLKDDYKEILEENLEKGIIPRNAYYGDGSEIDVEFLNQIKEAYEKERIEFKWHKGDLMILDNLLMAHGRNPFSGDRKIVVAMGD